MTAAIIGAGVAGIASAIRLAVEGYSVTVLEANAYPGGKLSSFDLTDPATGGIYRFDAGPSLFTMPQLVEELFTLAGRDMGNYFRYRRLDESCRYFWDDGTRLTAWADHAHLAADIETTFGETPQHLHDHLADSAAKFALTEPLFLRRSLHKAGTWLNRDALRGYLGLGKLGVFGTMHAANARRFRHPKLVQLFDRYATYNGSDPYQTPATLNIIPHLEHGIGTFFPADGMIGITNALVRLAEDLGVTFRYHTRVTEIVTEGGKVLGVKSEELRVKSDEMGVKSEELRRSGVPVKNEKPDTLHSYDIVISNMDVVNTFRRLLPSARQPERILRQPKSSSGLCFYWGIRQSLPELGLHNIFFSDDYQAEFQRLFRENTLSDDVTVYLNISSKHKPDDAPVGHENWFVLLNAPNNTGQDWDTIIARARQQVIARLSQVLGADIGSLITTEAVLDPRSIESRTSSAQGALYGNSSNNRFAAFLRHANFSAQFENLYFVGGSVHPGGGIPLCLHAARIATDLILEQAKG